MYHKADSRAFEDGYTLRWSLVGWLWRAGPFLFSPLSLYVSKTPEITDQITFRWLMHNLNLYPKTRCPVFSEEKS